MTSNTASFFRKVVNAEQYWVGRHQLRAGDVVNNSTVTGDTVEDALDYLSSGGVGPVLDLNGLTAATQTMVTSTAGTDFTIDTTGLSQHNFKLPNAGPAARGVVSTAAQTFAGDKTFSGTTTLSLAPVLTTGTLSAAGNLQTFPGSAQTLVGQTTTDALTNKTLTANTNNVIARGLWQASGASSVSTYAAAAAGAGGGQVLATDVGGTTASWQAVSALGAITSLGGQTGATQTFTTPNTGTDFTVVSSGNNHAFQLPDAAAGARGVVSTGVQTFAGAKTFSGIVTLSSAPVLSTGTITVGAGTVTIPAVTDTLVGKATTDTLTNKTLTDATTYIADEATPTKIAQFQCSGLSVGTTTFTFPNASATLVGDTNTQTLTNKTLTTATISSSTNTVTASGLFANSSTVVTVSGAALPTSGQVLTCNGTGPYTANWQTPVSASSTDTLTNKSLVDASTYIVDNGDATKKAQFECSTIGTGTTQTFTFPPTSTTLVGTGSTQTLTNKTLTTPIISQISNTGTLTLPTATDTLVGRTTTDTLTNKTATSNTNNLIARELWVGSGAGSVSTYAATAPSSGQVLTATSSTVATWQTPSTSGGIGTSVANTNFNASGVGLTNLVSTTATLYTTPTLSADSIYVIAWGCKLAGSVSAQTVSYLVSDGTFVGDAGGNQSFGNQITIDSGTTYQINSAASGTTTRHPGVFITVYVTTAGTIRLKVYKASADTVTISNSYVKIWKLN